MRILVWAVIAGLGLAVVVGCSEDPPIIAETDDIDAFATRVLNSIQDASIEGNREYCGYIYELDDGRLAATAPARGAEDYCDLPAPDHTTLASYHSHGGYSPEYDNEVPSIEDLTSDFADQIDGYVGTPAGRVWHIDYETQTAFQLCGARCILADPDHDPVETGTIPRRLNLDQIADRFAE